jgi:hypothetical protein
VIVPLSAAHHFVNSDLNDNSIFANFWLAIAVGIRLNGFGDNVGLVA